MILFSRLLKRDAATVAEVIVDRKEGLMWQRTHEPTKMSQNEAYGYCKSLRLGDHSDWLLPTLAQFRRLRQSDKMRQVVSQADDLFWTSSSDLKSGVAAQAYACDGRSFSKTDRFYVRAVRRL